MFIAPLLLPPIVTFVAAQQDPVGSGDVYAVGDVSLLGNAADTVVATTPPVVQHTFALRATNEAIQVTRLSPSCHCVGAVLAGKEKTSLPLTFAPGEETSVSVSINLSELRPGAFTKSVLVYAKKSPDSSEFLWKQLTVRGNLLPAVSFAPEGGANTNLFVLPLGTVDLSASAAGGMPGAILAATLDPRLLSGGSKAELPPLVSSNPGIQAKRLPDGGTKGTIRYRVFVAPDAPIGSLVGTISFAPSATDKSVRAAAWRSASLVVTGEVVGDITARPQVVAFGLEPQAEGSRIKSTIEGQPFSRTVTLTGKDAATFEGVKVESDNPNVTAGVLTITKPTAERTLVISLAPSAAKRVAENGPAFLQARVTVRLANGQRLILPVSAFRQQGFTRPLPVVEKSEGSLGAPKP